MCLAAWAPVGAQVPTARIHMDARQVANRITPFLYGSCIEDVNHEIYGGLYDQRLFGESFEEPPPGRFEGWTTYGGSWRLEDRAVRVNTDAGAKLVLHALEIGDGNVEAEVRFPDGRGDNAGLLVRVSDPGLGADNFNGYEISLRADSQSLLLGRHRHDWTPLQEVPMTFKANEWHRLRVQLDGPRIRVYVDNAVNPAVDFTDAERPLLGGRVALRTWHSNAAFRHVRVQTGQSRFENAFKLAGGEEVSGQWDAVRTGDARAEFQHDSINPYNGARSQMLYHGGGTGVAGVANRGLNRWGIAARRGQPFQGRVYLRAHDLRGPVTLALQSGDGSRIYATQTIRRVGVGWARYPFILTPNTSDANARFAVWIDRPGTLWVDQAVLMGSGDAQFKGLPFRADIGNALVSQGLRFLRYGGTMVNAPEYRWKKMIGDPDRRPPYRGHWYPYSTNGFGIEEFLKFCEAAGFEPAFAINVEESAQDAADLVEYLNGSVTTPWGRRRAQNGHPQPYNVRYIELGNEEVIGADNAADYEHYIERFNALHEAMHAKDPRIQFINAAWWRPDSPNMERVFKALNGKAAYWDLHPWTDDARAGRAVDEMLTQVRSLFHRWDANSTMKVAILEENGGLHNMQRALGHATTLNAVRRHGDFVLTSCPANALQPLAQNDNGWDQGQIFFTPSQVWGMPPYYVQQMASRHHLPLRVSSTCEGTTDLDITATRSENGKTLVLHVVNVGAAPVRAQLLLQGFAPAKPKAQVEQLAAPLGAVNTPENPARVRPQRSEWNHQAQDGAASYTFVAHSITILRFE